MGRWGSTSAMDPEPGGGMALSRGSRRGSGSRPTCGGFRGWRSRPSWCGGGRDRRGGAGEALDARRAGAAVPAQLRPDDRGTGMGGAGRGTEAEVDAAAGRQRRFDPDLWVVEVEDGRGGISWARRGWRRAASWPSAAPPCGSGAVRRCGSGCAGCASLFADIRVPRVATGLLLGTAGSASGRRGGGPDRSVKSGSGSWGTSNTVPVSSGAGGPREGGRGAP
jgi:hypothetical protein